MINKKIGVMTLGLTLMMLASCGPNSNKGNYVPPKAEGSDNITYFCPSTDVKYMEEVVAAFKAANPDYTGEITLQAEIGEGDVKAEVQKPSRNGGGCMDTIGQHAYLRGLFDQSPIQLVPRSSGQGDDTHPLVGPD